MTRETSLEGQLGVTYKDSGKECLRQRRQHCLKEDVTFWCVSVFSVGKIKRGKVLHGLQIFYTYSLFSRKPWKNFDKGMKYQEESTEFDVRQID